MAANTQTKERETPAAQPSAAPGMAMTAPVQTPAIAVIDGAEVPAFIRERDDEAMLSAFMGEVVQTWFYEFEVGGKKVEGVGVIGADEFARIQADRGCPITVVPYGINVIEVSRNEEKGVQATVVMRDARTRRESVGVAFYPYYLKKRDGTRTYDDKADRKALSVAKRNAILDLIPQAEILAVLKERKRLVGENQARFDREVEEVRRSLPVATAKVVAPATPGQPAAESYTGTQLHSHRVPRSAPTPPKVPADKRPTEAQTERLLDLAGNEAIDEEVRERVKTRLAECTLDARLAQTWIGMLEERVEAARAHTELFTQATAQ
jgi:hypothetical protein